ncbi:hypothetical protein HEK616_49790 [Streptomyces nigrescens]|uniref:Uncharacterized protein n=1 Tax=Streptomyces nigrescens TaxID=1920 RepID=A0ABN6QZ49_STRNI|nr:hypothetical protein [Streptomyces nigrescens]BDM71492.1 hypothetical protein HEK616_49790 [Streptomyces nigrescens]
MTALAVPPPEPDWEAAPAYQGGKRNPAFQTSAWEYAAAHFRPVAGLRVPLEALAARLRLTLESSWDDLGEMEVAMFRVRTSDFALTRHDGQEVVLVWLARATPEADTALELLLTVCGLDRRALSFLGNPTTGLTYVEERPG